ncbi:oligosaccharide flippase family protein [Aurantiacibacter zhengii]|uniref:Lipopolysaccharide biosynthesis protein n=1 Tax=Aurantiacibacter zhengii TaxID=2307003 RepID=A0A418NS18_9SPHN|nr:oligosaccharide flippase family protein [Aurantiacibacter zhengii]RIV85883.1 hypothetical protein D2V07_11280 [Aurantiacibacter zhengii]
MTDPVPKPARTIAQRLASGFAWSALGSFGWRALTAVSSVLVARILGPTAFGELGIVRSTANLFTVYAGFRLGTTASKHLAEYREKDPPKAGRILKMTLRLSAIFCATVALILIASSGYIARTTLNNADLAWPLRIAGVFLFFQAYMTVRESVLVGTEHFREFAQVNVAKGVLTAALIVPGAYFYGVTGAVAALALASFLSYLLLQYYIRRALGEFGVEQNVPFREWKAELPLLWNFALPGLLAGAVGALMPWYGRTVIAGIENGYVELGLFEAANQWRTMILFMPAILTRVAMPVLAETFGRSADDEFREAVVLQFQAILLLTLPLTVAAIAASDMLMLVFGGAYSEASSLLPILMLSVFLFALNQALRRVHDGSGYRWQYLVVQVLWAFAFLAVLWLTVADYGALSLALAILAAEFAMFLIQIGYVEFRIAPGSIRQVASNAIIAVTALALVICGQAHVFKLPEANWAIVGISVLISVVPAMRFVPALLRLRKKKTGRAN